MPRVPSPLELPADPTALCPRPARRLKDSTLIDANTAGGEGGGVFVSNGTMTMAATARIRDNTANTSGGVGNAPTGTGVDCGVNVLDNTPTDC